MSMEDVVRFGEVLEEMIDELREPGESKQEALDRITGKNGPTVSKSFCSDRVIIAASNLKGDY